MKVRKLASGKYSITDITPEEFIDLIAGSEGERKRFLQAEVPRKNGHEVREKMNRIAARFDAIATALSEAMY